MDQIVLRNGILRSLAFHFAWRYAPTKVQLIQTFDIGPSESVFSFSVSDLEAELDRCVLDGRICFKDGRYVFAGQEELIGFGREQERFFPRKLRRARLVALYLRAIPWVRAVFLCNTTALGQARDQADLDFLIIGRTQSLWRLRFCAAVPFVLLGLRPGAKRFFKDPVCLSFYLSERALSLEPLALPKDDPYLRYWFLSLLPLREDGVGSAFWEANKQFIRRHPFAFPWIALDESNIPNQTFVQLSSTGPSPWMEAWFRRLQWRRLPEALRSMANQDTRVVLRDDVLKFHTEDRRERFRDRYREICRGLDIDP